MKEKQAFTSCISGAVVAAAARLVLLPLRLLLLLLRPQPLLLLERVVGSNDASWGSQTTRRGGKMTCQGGQTTRAAREVGGANQYLIGKVKQGHGCMFGKEKQNKAKQIEATQSDA